MIQCKKKEQSLEKLVVALRNNDIVPGDKVKNSITTKLNEIKKVRNKVLMMWESKVIGE